MKAEQVGGSQLSEKAALIKMLKLLVQLIEKRCKQIKSHYVGCSGKLKGHTGNGNEAQT